MNEKITPEQLHINFIRLAKIIHPDNNPTDIESTEKFQELQKQYEIAQKFIYTKNQYHISISITLKEAIHGAERYFTIDDSGCYIMLTIPPGVKNKQTLLYRNLTIKTIQNVNVYIKIYIDIPYNFSIIGDQLILKEWVPFWKMYFGGEYIITGPDRKKILVKIPKKTKNGKMFKVQGAGSLDRIEKKRNPLYIQFFGSII
jgi:DnaJ-class molecular chaperone